MMTDLANQAHHATLRASAVATLGGSPAWDQVLSRYLACDALHTAMAEYGPLSQAHEARAWLAIELEKQHGKNWKDNLDAQARYAIADRAYQAADETYTADFLVPLWQAQRDLASTPAPTMAAAVFKAQLIEVEEVWNDNQFDLDCMQIVRDDFARLSGQAEARTTWDALIARFEVVDRVPLPDDDDSLIDEAGDLIEQIMTMPAPDADAVRWKLDYILAAVNGYTGGYCAEFVAQTVAE